MHAWFQMLEEVKQQHAWDWQQANSAAVASWGQIFPSSCFISCFVVKITVYLEITDRAGRLPGYFCISWRWHDLFSSASDWFSPADLILNLTNRPSSHLNLTKPTNNKCWPIRGGADKACAILENKSSCSTVLNVAQQAERQVWRTRRYKDSKFIVTNLRVNPVCAHQVNTPATPWPLAAGFEDCSTFYNVTQ